MATAREQLADMLRLAYEQLLGAAMPRAESLDLIRTAEERWKAQI